MIDEVPAIDSRSSMKRWPAAPSLQPVPRLIGDSVSTEENPRRRLCCLALIHPFRDER
jgi:hypothetical protein